MVRFVITSYSIHYTKLYEPVKGQRRPGTAKGQILFIADDFDRTPADFDDYLS